MSPVRPLSKLAQVPVPLMSNAGSRAQGSNRQIMVTGPSVGTCQASESLDLCMMQVSNFSPTVMESI